MANLKKAKAYAFATIAAAQTILEKYPNLSTTDSFISINASTNPFDFLMDLLKSAGGYDRLINVLSKFITYELDGIEYAIKGILIANIKDFISCSINPFISEDLIKEGICFDLSQIDITGQLLANPLDPKIGKYFYFGCDGMNSAAEVVGSLDFNAFLWYVINKSNGRVIWDNRLKRSKKSTQSLSDDDTRPIITIEYIERSSGLKNSDWSQGYLQVPYNNIIHVMLGDTTKKPSLPGDLVPDNYKKNYYRKRTLIQFNYDYVSSIKLFDSKVVAAQLLDKLTNALSIDMSLTFNQQLIKYEVSEIVKSVVETDDSEVSDCFFTFSNEKYNSMLEKAELVHAGLFSINGEQNNSITINPEDILNSLNGISEAASLEEQKTIIEGALTEISKTLSTTYEDEKNNLNFNVQMNFINNIINELTSVIVSSLISPKLYLLLAINFKLMGIPGMPDVKSFIAMSKNMLIQIIRMIRDLIIKFLLDYLMELLQPLIEMLSAKMVVESVQYYKTLIEQLIKACRLKRGGTQDWNMDNVDYADIIQTETQPIINEC